MNQRLDTEETMERVRISRSVERWFSAPFLFAIILLVVVFIMALIIHRTNPCEWMSYMLPNFCKGIGIFKMC